MNGNIVEIHICVAEMILQGTLSLITFIKLQKMMIITALQHRALEILKVYT